MMLRLIKFTFVFLCVVFVLPGIANLAVWSIRDAPSSWHNADWSSAGVLAKPELNEAAVYILAARTGGLKGAFATHSWLVLKRPGSINYDRYDVVGWGTPVRQNAYAADGRWYSNDPVVEYHVSGKQAELLIPKIETAIRNYRWRNRGDYTIWPGPNSNTFVASVIRSVPGFDAVTPSTAIGRDFPADGAWLGRSKAGTLRATLAGYAGFVVGRSEGFELNFLGLVAGFNPTNGEIKIPAFGSWRLW